MYISHSKKGKEIESEFLDWCLMNTRIADIQDEENVSEDKAYEMFWDEVRDYDAEVYDLILQSYNGDFNEALGYGAFDEIRAEYVSGLSYEYNEYKETSINVGDRVMLIDVPKCMPEELYKVGTFKGYTSVDSTGKQCVDILLDGDDGLTVCYEDQIMKL